MSGLPDGMYAYTLTTLGGVSQLTAVWKANLSLGGEGTSAVVRAGVVYVAAESKQTRRSRCGDVRVRCSAARPIGGGVHWESPMIARGVVYVTDESHNLTAFEIAPNAGGAVAGARSPSWFEGGRQPKPLRRMVQVGNAQGSNHIMAKAKPRERGHLRIGGIIYMRVRGVSGDRARGQENRAFRGRRHQRL